ARPGKRKRKLGGMAKALQRYSAWNAGSNSAESPAGAPSKRQRKTSSPGAKEQCGGSGTSAPHKPSTHTTSTHYDLKQRFCHEDGCTTWSSYGSVRSQKAEFCSKHTKPGMIDLVSKRCGHPGCMKHPSYGKSSSKKPEFCAQHR
ncbi:unnamed protein product, partial [Ectocarpus sp. 12 AP-2014]